MGNTISLGGYIGRTITQIIPGNVTLKVHSTDFNRLQIAKNQGIEGEFKVVPLDSNGNKIPGKLELDVNKILLVGYTINTLTYHEDAEGFSYAILKVAETQAGLQKYEIQIPANSAKLWDDSEKAYNLNTNTSLINTPAQIKYV